MSSSETNMTKCITCGDALHPERARKYNYCLKPECQAKNLKGLTMVAVGVNKSAEQYLLLAQGKYHDQRRGTFGQPEPAPGPPRTARPAAPGPAGPVPAGLVPADTAPADTAPARPARASTAPASSAQPSAGPASSAQVKPGPASTTPAAPRGPRLPGTASQRRLAVLYNQQGLRPDEIAGKLGLSRYDVTQIVLAARSRGRS
jgi:hypothetical protein